MRCLRFILAFALTVLFATPAAAEESTEVVKPVLIVLAKTDLPNQGKPYVDLIDLERYFVDQLGIRRFEYVFPSATNKLSSPPAANEYLLELSVDALQSATRATRDEQGAYHDDPVFVVELSVTVRHALSGQVLGKRIAPAEYHLTRDEINELAPPRAALYASAKRLADFFADEVSQGNLGQQISLSQRPSSYVSVLLGNGDGTFGPRSDFPVLKFPDLVVSGDFNGDGKTDIAVCSSFGGVSVLLGNGDGTFAAHKDTPVGGSYNCATGDFNADGKLDLAAANVVDNAVSILLGNGDGTFSVQPPIPASPFVLTVGDFNGDGKPDIATSSTASKVSVLLGNGDGTFGPLIDVATGLSPYFIITKDFNGDGKQDLAIANIYTGSVIGVTILLNTSH